MSIIRLARPVEIPLLERCGYRAVRQRGGLVEMERVESSGDELHVKHENPLEFQRDELVIPHADRDAERLAFEVMAIGRERTFDVLSARWTDPGCARTVAANVLMHNHGPDKVQPWSERREWRSARREHPRKVGANGDPQPREIAVRKLG